MQVEDGPLAEWVGEGDRHPGLAVSYDPFKDLAQFSAAFLNFLHFHPLAHFLSACAPGLALGSLWGQTEVKSSGVPSQRALSQQL